MIALAVLAAPVEGGAAPRRAGAAACRLRQRDVRQGGGQLGEDGGGERAAHPVGERDGAGGEDHAVVEQRLDQALAQQVGLPGGRRPPARAVDQVEVVEGVHRVRASPGRPRGERGGVGGGGPRRSRPRCLVVRRRSSSAERRGRAGGGQERARSPPGGRAARRLRVAAAQQLAAVAARGERGGGGGVGAADVLERRQHPVGDEHACARILAEHVDLLPGRGRRPHDVLDAKPAGDLGGHHDVRVVVEPVGPGHDGHAGLHQRGGDEAAVLAASQAELDRAARVPQRRDGGDERLSDLPRAPGRSAGPKAGPPAEPGAAPWPASPCR